MGRHLRTVVQSQPGASTTASAKGLKRRTMTTLGDPGRSPAHYALFEAIRYKRHRQALLLVEAGADVNCRNERGQTPLIYIVLTVDEDRSRAKLIRLFLDAGADPNIPDWQGLTVLMHSSILGQMEVVKPLLECKLINPAAKDPEGNTALMYASSIGHLDIISAFIAVFRHDIGALQLGQRNNQGFTALHLASRNGHDTCARLLTREAQLFPTAIEEFPDPKDLERDPTPCDIVTIDKDYSKKPPSCKRGRNSDFEIPIQDGGKSASRLADNKYFEMTMAHFSLHENGCSSDPSVIQRVNEDSDGRRRDEEYIQGAVTPAFVDHTKPNLIVSGNKVPVKAPNDFHSTSANGNNLQNGSNGFLKELSQKMFNMWPALPSKAPPSRCSKALEPLEYLEGNPKSNSAFINSIADACEWENSVSGIFYVGNRNGNRSLSESRGKNSDSWEPIKGNAFGSTDHLRSCWEKENSSMPSWLNRKEQNGVCVVKNRAESVSNLLPIISCSKEGSLPPVKSGVSSKRAPFYAPGSSLINVRVDLPSADLEMGYVKKNVTVK